VPEAGQVVNVMAGWDANVTPGNMRVTVEPAMVTPRRRIGQPCAPPLSAVGAKRQSAELATVKLEMTLAPFKIWLCATEAWQRSWAEVMREAAWLHYLRLMIPRHRAAHMGSAALILAVCDPYFHKPSNRCPATRV